MNAKGRIAVVVAAAVVAVGGYLVLRPTNDDNGGSNPSGRAVATRTSMGAGENTRASTGTAAVRPQDALQAKRFALTLRGGELVSGPRRIEVSKGDRVVITVTSDRPAKLHLHGYDIERDVAPGRPARFAFEAAIEGSFEIESHTTGEHIARVEVRPQ